MEGLPSFFASRPKPWGVRWRLMSASPWRLLEKEASSATAQIQVDALPQPWAGENCGLDMDGGFTPAEQIDQS